MNNTIRRSLGKKENLLNSILLNPYLRVVILIGILSLTPIILKDRFYLDGFFYTLLWASAASAWNIVGGYAGQLSLGHAAFFGIGAYIPTILFLHLGFTPWIGALIAAIVATICGLVLGAITFRFEGPFFAMSTLAFGEVLRLIASTDNSITRGVRGLAMPPTHDPANMIFTGKAPYVYLALFILAVILLVCAWLGESKEGYYLLAFREDKIAAEHLGINTVRVRLVAMAGSASLASLAGTLYAQYILLVLPESVFPVSLSVQFALIAALGGQGTVFGPLLGSFIITPLGQALRAWLGGGFGALHLLIYGILIILIVRLLPKGLIDLIMRLLGRMNLSKEGS